MPDFECCVVHFCLIILGASSPESFPLIFALLFSARACGSKVCLLEGYSTEKWVPTLTIGKQLYEHLEFPTQVNSAFRAL